MQRQACTVYCGGPEVFGAVPSQVGRQADRQTGRSQSPLDQHSLCKPSCPALAFFPVGVLGFQRHSDRHPLRADPCLSEAVGRARRVHSPGGASISPPQCPSPEDASCSSLCPVWFQLSTCTSRFSVAPKAHRRPQHEIAAFCSGSTVTTSAHFLKFSFPALQFVFIAVWPKTDACVCSESLRSRPTLCNPI